MKIAFFDSGIGGLSVLAEALRRFSGAEFLYFADEDHVPYGTKSRAEIARLSLDAVGFLVSRGAEGVVVACNTATSAAISELRGAFSVPVIGMEPAVKLAADSFGARPTLLIATPLTIAGEKLARLVGRLECETWSLPLPSLVEFAQDLEFDSPAVRAYLREELAKFELERLGSLVLGCTHFNYFKDVLREILPPHVRIIDGIDGTLNRLVSELGGRIKLACGENLSAQATKFNADGDVKFDTNSSAQGGKIDAEVRGAGGGQSIKGKSKRGSEGRGEGEQGKEGGDEQGAERCDESGGKIYYPNGNSVEYFYSGRALDAAQLRKVELFLKRLDAMREID
ncbi:MAG: glutamate racemase [Campylobacter sp.]|uniref:glutamate racemase n=1 Tax=Campylobacter sp. TaxID=205 RepID=UPI003F9F1C9F